MTVLADLTATATLSLAGVTFALVLVTLLLAEITRRGNRDARDRGHKTPLKLKPARSPSHIDR